MEKEVIGKEIAEMDTGDQDHLEEAAEEIEGDPTLADHIALIGEEEEVVDHAEDHTPQEEDIQTEVVHPDQEIVEEDQAEIAEDLSTQEEAKILEGAEIQEDQLTAEEAKIAEAESILEVDLQETTLLNILLET